MPRTPLEVHAPSARVGQIPVRPPPPQISKPVRLWPWALLDLCERKGCSM